MDEGMFYIGELAERTGVSRDTIRYYETLGVLPEAPRTAGGYRLYGDADVDRIEFVGQAQALGLTLEEISDVLGIVDEGRTPCRHVRERLAARLEETRERIVRLRDLERRLETTLTKAEAEADEMATDGPPGCRCRIIEIAGLDPGADSRG